MKRNGSWKGSKGLRCWTPFLSISLFIFLLLIFSHFYADAWSNGGDSTDPNSPVYGTHDWLVERALAYLPDGEKTYLLANKNILFLGTELPDNSNLPGGIGDVSLHHVYFYANGTLQDNASARRAEDCFQLALQNLVSGNYTGAAQYAGCLSHYLADVGVFGHVMASGTAWGRTTSGGV